MLDTSTRQNLTPKKAVFLAAYEITARIASAARAAGVSRRAHYYWLRDNQDYQKAFVTARAIAIARLEEEVRYRALVGPRRYRFNSKGEPIIDPRNGKPYFDREPSDVLLMLLLKALAPHKYRE
jgi:hypothetical protein